MIRNYFNVAIRNLLKNRAFSLINILGLTLGITVSLLIVLWVRDEKSVDAFHANKAQLFRIYERQYFNGSLQGIIWTQGPLAAELKQKVPEVEMATPYSWTSQQVFRVGDKSVKEGVNTASPDFFKMFSFPLLAGSPETALSQPNSLAISEKMARTFFSSPKEAIGKSILYDNRKNFTISAVFKTLPSNSSLQFECLMDWQSYLQDNDWATSWGNNDPLTFVMTRKDADPALVEKKIKHFLDTYIEEPDLKKRTQLALQPFHEYYLHDQFKDAEVADGRIRYVRIFSFVALFILVIACINFMNLSTARSAMRAKEVGVRKVMGAGRSALTIQFFSEAILMVLFATLLSIAAATLLLPVFNQLTGKQINFPYRESSFWIFLAILVLFTGVVAGSYPSLFLSRLLPVRVLKGNLRIDPKSALIRKGLVVMQFSLSIILIVGMMVINRQVRYVQDTNPGFNRENLVYFPIEGEISKKYESFKQELLSVPGVRVVSNISENPVSMNFGMDNISWEGQDPNTKLRFTPVGVGYDFIKGMDLQLAKGRDFSPQYATDSLSVLINETAANAMTFENPVGKIIKIGGKNATIIGVIRDFHFQSFHSAIRPLFAYLRVTPGEGSILVRVDGKSMNKTMAGIEEVYKKFNPSYPFQFSFTDEQYAIIYRNERMVSSLSGYFASLAIFISCLGLLGLALFTAEQRSKEISIRKVLGAGLASLFYLLTADFLALIVLALLIAAPIAWWLTGNWLSDFAYHIHLSWLFILAAGTLALLIALATISYQMIRTALVNPTKILRNE